MQIEHLSFLLKFIQTTNILDLAAKIDVADGFLTYTEGAALYMCAAFGSGSGEIVEIGSFKGRSTIWLAKGSLDSNREKVTAIDPHIGSHEHQPGGKEHHHMPEEGTTYLTFERNLRVFGLREHVTPIVAKSEDAVTNWNKPIRLLFIDGDHSSDMVAKDFEMWSPYVVQGGIIAFHDIYNSDGGPDMVVNATVRNNPKYREIGHVNGLYMTTKL